MTNPFALLDARRSTPYKQLGEPGPDEATLLRMLQSAVRVPDHGRRVPFRFVRIAGEHRFALGELFEALTRQRTPEAGDAVFERERQRFSYAPVIIAVLAEQGEDERIPKHERFATASCVCFALLQAAQLAGFGAQWLTGWSIDDASVRSRLGVGEEEAIVGYIHIGAPALQTPERERPNPAELLSDFKA